MIPDGSGLPLEGRGADHELAKRHQPLLRLDAREPYSPLVYGYTVFREARRSPSSKFAVDPEGGTTIEYAVWYDWDIQHLYDLEHVWVRLDADGAVIGVDASYHGKRLRMDCGDGMPELAGGRPVVYAEPGKHAHWADGNGMAASAGPAIVQKCGENAGAEGVHLGNPFATQGLYAATPFEHRLAKLKMQRDRFVPAFAFDRSSDDGDGVRLVPWTTLAAWIPARVRHLMDQLPESVPHLAAVFLDCGDTLIDEATEERMDGSDVVVRAEDIPDAMEAVRLLHAQGYRLALVADGPRGTFENLLRPRGIWSLMDAHAISGDVGELKPSPKMFAAAMAEMGLADSARSRIVMVGNNLARDIRGANEFGLISLFVAWSRRRTHEPADALETPEHRIEALDALVPAIEAIELALGSGAA